MSKEVGENVYIVLDCFIPSWGTNAEQDAERIIKLKEKFGNHFILRVDANTGYTLQQLQLFIEKTKDQGVELIEQPMPPAQDKELLQLPETIRAILAADESLKDAKAALSLSQTCGHSIILGMQ